MRRITRNIRRVLSAIGYLIFAAVIVVAITFMTIYFSLSSGQRGFLVVLTVVGATVLVVRAVDIFHKTWKKEELDE